MNCMKCGRETAEDQVFCKTCLEDMERCPVKPGTVVHIPNRSQEDEIRKIQYRRKPLVSMSDQIIRLRKKLLWTRVALALLLLICGLLCFAVGRVAMDWETESIPGQNYSVEDTSGSSAAP